MMKNKNYLFIVAAVIVLILTGCARTEEGRASDEVYSVERSITGGYGIYLKYDDSTVYCTTDPEIGELAESLLNLPHEQREVVIIYKEKRWYEDTEGTALGISQCGTYYDDFNPVIITEFDLIEE